MEELESCPFCGERDCAINVDAVTRVAWICCSRCGATGPATGEKRAAAVWNERAERTAIMRKDPGSSFWCDGCCDYIDYWCGAYPPTYCPTCGARVRKCIYGS